MRVELLHVHENEPENIEPLIKRVAHISYQVDKSLSEEAASKFIQKHVLNAGHYGLLRHSWFTMSATMERVINTWKYFSLPNNVRQYMVFQQLKDNLTLVSGTIEMWMNFYKCCPDLPVPQALHQMAPTVFPIFQGCLIPYDCSREGIAYTFLISECSRLFTHQLVRHGHNIAFNQESTRYVDYSKGFDMVIPKKMESINQTNTAYRMLEEVYSELRDQGAKKEDARFFLPNGIHSQIAATLRYDALFGRLKETRADGKTGKPSNEIQEAVKTMIEIVESLKTP